MEIQSTENRHIPWCPTKGDTFFKWGNFSCSIEGILSQARGLCSPCLSPSSQEVPVLGFSTLPSLTPALAPPLALWPLHLIMKGAHTGKTKNLQFGTSVLFLLALAIKPAHGCKFISFSAELAAEAAPQLAISYRGVVRLTSVEETRPNGEAGTPESLPQVSSEKLHAKSSPRDPQTQYKGSKYKIRVGPQIAKCIPMVHCRGSGWVMGGSWVGCVVWHLWCSQLCHNLLCDHWVEGGGWMDT